VISAYDVPMSADDFVWLLTQAVLFLVFVIVVAHAVRHRQRASFDIAAFFAAIAGILVVSDLRRLASEGSRLEELLTLVSLALLLTLPYLLLRVVDDLRRQPRWLMVAAFAATVAMVVASIVLPRPVPTWFLLAVAVWFGGLVGYVTVAFVRGGQEGTGVTARRMLAASLGSALIAAAILLAIAGAVAPQISEWTSIATRISGLGAALAYFIAFSTPRFVRRAWQEPELRAFLSRAATLPRLPDTEAIVRELEEGAASSTGAAHAVIGLWDEGRGMLVYHGPSGRSQYPDDELIGGRAFARQRAIFSDDAARDDPEHAELYRTGAALAILAAPISAGGQRIGVLCVYAERAPIFAHDDLELVQLLADQAAVILESRRLIDHAAQVMAREEAARLKDDFLSAAAHDLRTPLTTLLIQSQMLQRQIGTAGEDEVTARRVASIHNEAMRLRDLVTDYLDASRAERGELIGNREETDLAALAGQACERHSTRRHPCRMEGEQAVIGEFDAGRIGQLLDNLLGNAIKYSPEGGEVVVRTWAEGSHARLSVSDQGIGIPAGDLPNLFDRFHRGGNVDDRRFQGLGLGLYICRGIVEQHGGRIWATSEAGKGSTFHVELPLRAAREQPDRQPPPEADPGTRRAAGAPAGG
jgi:signal transduction histidine kinase